VTPMLDYEWRLRALLAEKGIFNAQALRPELERYGLGLSATQVWRIVTGKPERLNLRLLMVLCDLLECTPNDLIRPVEESINPAKAAGARSHAELKDVVPKPARVRRDRG
jgi:DNA-binding Xre family transcriptional regulator